MPVSCNYYMKNCKFVNRNKIFDNLRFLKDNTMYDIATLKSKFFYDVLCQAKSERSYCEQYWQNLFDLEMLNSDWTRIYNAKVWHIPIQKISEFNYKILHNLITCRNSVSKWKKEITPNCYRVELFYRKISMHHLLNESYDFNVKDVLEDIKIVLSEFYEVNWLAN